MTKNLKCIIVDDDEGFREQCQKRLSRATKRVHLEIVPTSRDDLVKAIAALEAGLSSARKAAKAWKPPTTLFDQIDIAFVDYDLLDLGGSSTISGEDVAYLLRVLTRCGVIVLLNPPDLGINGFDLRLQGNLDSWADFRIGSSQMDRSWLWNESPQGLSPWSWPNLPIETLKRRTQLATAKKQLKENIMTVLGVKEQNLHGLDMAMAEGILKSRAQPLRLRELATNPTTGLRTKDMPLAKMLDDNAIARIAAARLTAWVDRVALPSQSFFVDGPHLAGRIPGALARDGNHVAVEHTISRDWQKGKQAFVRAVAKHMPTAALWFTRPVWVWPSIRSDDLFDKWSTFERAQHSSVFCEDTSRFAGMGEAKRFTADVAPQFSVRYAANVSGVDYRPGFRFAL